MGAASSPAHTDCDAAGLEAGLGIAQVVSNGAKGFGLPGIGVLETLEHAAAPGIVFPQISQWVRRNSLRLPSA